MEEVLGLLFTVLTIGSFFLGAWFGELKGHTKGYTEAYVEVMEEAYNKGYAVQCEGVRGYYWTCDNAKD